MSDIRREMRPNSVTGRERVSISNLVYNETSDMVTMRLRDNADLPEALDRIRKVTRPSLGGGLGLGLRPYLVSETDGRIEIAMTPEAQRYYSTEAVRDSIEVVRRRIDPAGNKEVSIQPQGNDRIVVQVPGDDDPEALKAVINRTGQLSFHQADPSVNPQDAANGLLPPGRILVPFAEFEGSGAPPIVLYEDAEVTGDMVENASAGPNPDGAGFQINFTFDSRGARRFG